MSALATPANPGSDAGCATQDHAGGLNYLRMNLLTEEFEVIDEAGSILFAHLGPNRLECDPAMRVPRLSTR
jgi:hypothetical protein